MVENHGVAIVAFILPENPDEKIQLYRLSNIQGKGHTKLDKHVAERRDVDPKQAFSQAYQQSPIENGLFRRSFSESFTYDRPTQDSWGSLTRKKTEIHTYLAVCRPEDVDTSSKDVEGEWAKPPFNMSFKSEHKIVGAGGVIIKETRQEAEALLDTETVNNSPYDRNWVTYNEIKDSRSFEYGWDIEFEKPDDKPWTNTDASFGEPYTHQEISRAAKSHGLMGLCGAELYCHNHNCEKGNREQEIQASTVLSMMEKSPQGVPSKKQEELEERKRERASITTHQIVDGEIWYLLMGPNTETGKLELSGWYCCPECATSVVWPTDNHIAVASEITVPHAPDQRRSSARPKVSEIRGVYASEASISQSSLESFT